MSARKFPEGELAFRSERGQEAAEHKRRSARPQKLETLCGIRERGRVTTYISKTVRKRPSGRLAP